MSVEEAARALEAPTGAPPIPSSRKMTRQERQEQDVRLRRFLALSPDLQEGALRYGENIRASYKGVPISIK